MRGCEGTSLRAFDRWLNSHGGPALVKEREREREEERKHSGNK